jgi:hypothetical protein
VGDRRLVLADEPTGALDSVTGESVLMLLRQRVDRGAGSGAGHPRGAARRLGRTAWSSCATAGWSTRRAPRSSHERLATGAAHRPPRAAAGQGPDRAGPGDGAAAGDGGGVPQHAAAHERHQPVESLPRELGAASARLEHTGSQMEQHPDSQPSSGFGNVPVPTPAQLRAALPAGSGLLEVRTAHADDRIEVGDQRRRVGLVAVDLTDPELTGPYARCPGALLPGPTRSPSPSSSPSSASRWAARWSSGPAGVR